MTRFVHMLCTHMYLPSLAASPVLLLARTGRSTGLVAILMFARMLVRWLFSLFIYSIFHVLRTPLLTVSDFGQSENALLSCHL